MSVRRLATEQPATRGSMLADVCAILGSLDIVFRELDR